MAAALGALGDDGVDAPLGHLLGVAAGADRGHDEEPGLLAAGHQGRVGRLGEAGDPGPGLDHERRCARPTSATSVRRLTPNGACVRAAHLGHGRAPAPRGSWWPRPGSRARRPGGGGHQAGARPPSPCRSARAGSARRRARRTRCAAPGAAASAAGVASASCTSRSRSGPGSSTSRRARALRAWAGASRRTSSGTARANPVARDDLVDGDAGVVRAQPHGAVRRLEVEDAQVRDDAADVVEAGGTGPGGGGPGVAHPAHHVDLLDERAHAVVGHPVAGRVVDRVARGAAHADQLHLGRRGHRWPRCSGCRCGRSGWPSS